MASSVYLPNGLVTSVVNLTAAQIKTLHSVPVTLVSAPGAGVLLVPSDVFFDYKFGTVGFDTTQAGNYLELTIGGAPLYVDPSVDPSATPDQFYPDVYDLAVSADANVSRWLHVLVSATSIAGFPSAPRSSTANQPLIFKAEFDSAVGDGTMRITTLYRAITLS